jgi:hypothetical protein
MNNQADQIDEVKCYSGYTYAEYPSSFTWHGAEHEVRKIDKMWREPGERHFRVRVQDDRIFELCYYEREDEWSLIEITD